MLCVYGHECECVWVCACIYVCVCVRVCTCMIADTQVFPCLPAFAAVGRSHLHRCVLMLTDARSSELEQSYFSAAAADKLRVCCRVNFSSSLRAASFNRKLDLWNLVPIIMRNWNLTHERLVLLEGENNPSLVCRKPALVRLKVPESPGSKAYTTQVLEMALKVIV